jgi:hypothetical protein
MRASAGGIHSLSPPPSRSRCCSRNLLHGTAGTLVERRTDCQWAIAARSEKREGNIVHGRICSAAPMNVLDGENCSSLCPPPPFARSAVQGGDSRGGCGEEGCAAQADEEYAARPRDHRHGLIRARPYTSLHSSAPPTCILFHPRPMPSRRRTCCRARSLSASHPPPTRLGTRAAANTATSQKFDPRRSPRTS